VSLVLGNRLTIGSHPRAGSTSIVNIPVINPGFAAPVIPACVWLATIGTRYRIFRPPFRRPFAFAFVDNYPFIWHSILAVG
jgi:hypothetical protein